MSSARAVLIVRRRLASQIRRARLELGLNQDQLGDAAGLSGKFIGELERAQKSPTVDTLSRLAGALRKPLSKIVEQRGGIQRRHRRAS